MFRITILYESGARECFDADRLPEIERQEPVEDWLNEMVQACAQTRRRGPLLIDLGHIDGIFQERIGTNAAVNRDAETRDKKVS